MITREEYELLKYYRAEGYSYLSRDKDNLLCMNMYKPRKLNERWLWDTNHLLINRDNLKCIRWEDEEATLIADLINEYESHQVITGGNNVNKAELVKEIEDILYNIGIHDYRIGERCENYHNWGINSENIRKIFSAIEKHIPISVGEKVKVTVPQFVADWIEEVKAFKLPFELEYLFDTTQMPDDVYDWLDERYGDTDILARAWIYGYEVEKEKQYILKFSNGQYLYSCDLGMTDETLACKLTQAEIEAIDPRLMQFAVEVE